MWVNELKYTAQVYTLYTTQGTGRGLGQQLWDELIPNLVQQHIQTAGGEPTCTYIHIITTHKCSLSYITLSPRAYSRQYWDMTMQRIVGIRDSSRRRSSVMGGDMTLLWYRCISLLRGP